MGSLFALPFFPQLTIFGPVQASSWAILQRQRRSSRLGSWAATAFASFSATATAAMTPLPRCGLGSFHAALVPALVGAHFPLLVFNALDL